MKKTFYALFLAASLMMAACGSASDPEGTGTSGTESNPAQSENMPSTEETNGLRENGAWKEITQGGPYGSISLSLPDGWSYELCAVDDEKLLSGDYGIHIFPDAASDGYVEVAYISSFGVCGTGLKEETVTLAGDSANVGYYDGSKIWEFVVFGGDNTKIVAMTSSVDSWWTDYSDQVMEILDTLVFQAADQTGAIGVYYEDSYLEKPAIMVWAVNISETGATIRFRQYDASIPEELSFGEDFKVEKKDGDNWQEADIVAEGNFAFHDVACIIAKDDFTEFVYDWEWLYGSLEPGEYRIRINIMAQKSDGGYDNYTAYAHFILR